MTCGPTRTSGRSTGNGTPSTKAVSHRPLTVLLFVALLAAFAAGIWGTVIRPAAYEVRGTIVARSGPDMIRERRAPGAAPVRAMAGRAQPEVESLTLRRAGRRPRGI